MNGTIAAVIAGLVAILAVIGFLTGDDDGSPDAPGPSIAAIARRVERVRELRFDHLPRVRHVSGAQARADGLRELDREIPRPKVAAEERLLTLLGLLPPRSSLRELFGKTLSSEVGGYYLPRTGTLSVVGSGGQAGLLGEITLAHELTHALEDQHFDLGSGAATGFQRDRSMADSALHEGTATIAMVDYAVLKATGRNDIPAVVRAQALKALDKAAVPASSGLPRYVRESLVFPYAAGARLVNRIESRGGWAAVNRAFGAQAPLSTEQLMHPAKYDAHERPVRVVVAPPPRHPAGRARRLRRVRHRAAAAGRQRASAVDARGGRMGRRRVRAVAHRGPIRPDAPLALGQRPGRPRVRAGAAAHRPAPRSRERLRQR